ncbi:MAG TPA: UDP-N-acetylmuramoyl-L-alanine--D-glutamate ligase [Streptosporangiaceae bacterium]|nr:UDP-N-acetylmuramoyl-L-alanine--D-glutamate ligase [Streptosporangiaceae bacterium]
MAADLTDDFTASLRSLRVCVAGLGVSGPPAARVLASLGASVVAVDSRDDDAGRALAGGLARDGVQVLLGDAAAATLPDGTGLVVTSPGWQPDAPLLAAAAAAGVDVIGDVELAWRLRPALADGRRQRWLAVTGTNGKTTTVRMLALMLAAAGYRSVAAGNVGTSLIDAVTEPEPYEVVAVELSSFQLHWSSTIAPRAAALLNVAAHHLDWHGTFEAYAAAKARIFAPGTIAIGNADDRWSAEIAAGAGRDGKADRVVMFRLGEPGPGELGVRNGYLIDRAFGTAGTRDEEVRLARVADASPPAPHNVADALAAAALARAYGADSGAVGAGLRAFTPDPHRIALVGTVAGVDYVDDSKATNPHAAAASLASYERVVWVAGGLLKGSEGDLDGLVGRAAPRLRGVVLLGADRAKIAAALGRHAPEIPVAEIAGTGAGIMDDVVTAAAALAEPGDTVLLAPAAQSFDMFQDYPARGEAFAEAVTRLCCAGVRGPS